MAFLPDGSMPGHGARGRLRIIRNGKLDPTPIAGTPPVFARVLAGLLDVALHPRFAENRVVYLSYSKAGENNLSATALARAVFDGTRFRTSRTSSSPIMEQGRRTNYGGRIAFDQAGLLYLTVGERQEQDRAQKPDDHGGKVLRLRDDGSVPPDNPFVGKPGYLPEIYSLGHRSPQGLAMNPATGAIWENEHGPLGGDELNIILPGKNYGWPLVTFGTGLRRNEDQRFDVARGSRGPFVYWVPSIAVSGSPSTPAIASRRGRGTCSSARVPRPNGAPVTFSGLCSTFSGKPINREPLLGELRQRIRDVRQGPDGLLYVLTDEDAGMLLRIEPGN